MKLKIHFVGVGGMGLSALALYSKFKGNVVSGSDLGNGPMIGILKKNGVIVDIGHSVFECSPDLVVRSSAVPESDPEITFARENGVKIADRMDFFSSNVRPLVGITGTDGKSSTTCMTEWIAVKNGMDTGFLCGAVSNGFGNSTFRPGESGIIAEVDESDPKMENVKAKIAVLTNLRYDHLDRYGEDPSRQLRTVKKFMDRAGMTIAPANFGFEPTLGLGKGGDLNFSDLRYDLNGQNFKVLYGGEKLPVYLPVLGKHQAENALAAIGAGILLGISPENCTKALSDYPGLHRRLEILRGGRSTVIDDYAHTPDEVSAALDAVSGYRGRIIAVFEPHRYTRFVKRHTDFAKALSRADEVYVTEIFGAFENGEDASGMLVDDLRSSGKTAATLKMDEVAEVLKRKAGNGLYLFMGAGRITYEAHNFSNILEE